MSPAKIKTDWIEIPVFIHGITPQPRPAFPIKEYTTLLKNVNAALQQQQKNPFSHSQIFVEWGHTTRQSSQMDQYLAEVERVIARKVRRSMGPASYAGPLRAYEVFRNLFFFGVADIFYYVSADGENALRTHVFRYLAKRISEIDRQSIKRISLTFFAHSAGSVIAHDFLFHLFGKKNPGESEEKPVFDAMHRLRRMVETHRLRVRKLYTFGSPISPLALRSDALIEKIRKNTPLDPEAIGLRKRDALKNPRWVNFWEREDLISYPVSFFYSNAGRIIEDKSLNLGPLWKNVHLLYWNSAEMADTIAETF